MKILSWNVNGLRSVLRKNALEKIYSEDPDIICLQETRCPLDTEWIVPACYKYKLIVPSAKPGYAGVALVSKWRPQRIIETSLEQGRCICAEFRTFFLIKIL